MSKGTADFLCVLCYVVAATGWITGVSCGFAGNAGQAVGAFGFTYGLFLLGKYFSKRK